MAFASPDDPYRDQKKYHMADLRRSRYGRMTALCFRRPRAIDLRLALWTITPSAVTCRDCLAIMGRASSVSALLTAHCLLLTSFFSLYLSCSVL